MKYNRYFILGLTLFCFAATGCSRTTSHENIDKSMNESLNIIVFRMTEDTFGMPTPFIEDGTIIILYQDGVATIGRYNAPKPPESLSPSFDHPLNEEELKDETLQAVLKIHSSLDSFNQSYVFLCPIKLANKAKWTTNAH